MYLFFNDPATTEIYTLSLHDALPISRYQPAPQAAGHALAARQRRGCGRAARARVQRRLRRGERAAAAGRAAPEDRKSTRLNSSHANISYADFCLKKKEHTRRGARPSR